MNDKIRILDIGIDDYTAKRAMQETVACMGTEPVSLIEMMSVDTLMYTQENPELRDCIEQMDLVLPGEKAILEAAEIRDSRHLQEIERQTYLKMFLRYLDKNHRRIFLLVETEEEVQEFCDFLADRYRGIQIAGIARVSQEDQADDLVVNAVNGGEVDCVIAALSSPLQEEFGVRNRALLNARVWLGSGKIIRGIYKSGSGRNRLMQFILHRIFKREIEKNKKEM